MSKFSLDTLTEGIRARHLGSQNRQLVEKWSRTGLLRGLDGGAKICFHVGFWAVLRAGLLQRHRSPWSDHFDLIIFNW